MSTEKAKKVALYGGIAAGMALVVLYFKRKEITERFGVQGVGISGPEEERYSADKKGILKKMKGGTVAAKGVKLTKAQIQKFVEVLGKMPKVKGWDPYWDKEVKPKVEKVLIIISTGAMLVSLPIGVTVVAMKKMKKTKDLPKKARKVMVDMLGEVMGRMMNIVVVYILEGKDINATIKAVKEGRTGDITKGVRLDYTKIETKKIVQAALLIADDAVPVAAAGATPAATAAGGVPGVVTGVISGVTTGVAVGTDVLAFKMIVDALSDAIVLEDSPAKQ